MSEYDYLFKVIVVGDGAVGKTAITIRFSEGRFEEHYKMTIGVDFAIKLLEISGYKIKMQIWDTGGQERFSYIRPLYYKGAMAALAIFDLTNRESYDNLHKWFTEVADNCGPIPLMLVGNKCDLPDRAVERKEAEELSNRLGLTYYEASAKSGDNIATMFKRLGEMLLENKVSMLTKPIAHEFAKAEIPSTSTIIAPPPIAHTISSAPKPPTFTPPKIPSFESTPISTSTPETPTTSSPSLDEALKILEGTEEITYETPVTPSSGQETFNITPPTPETIEMKPPTIETAEVTTTEIPTMEVSPVVPEDFEMKPPALEPIAEPIDLTPPIIKPVAIPIPKMTPPPIDTQPPVPKQPFIESRPTTKKTSSSFIPFSSLGGASSSTSSKTESRPIFVPFTSSSSTPSSPPAVTQTPSTTGASWIDFLKATPKVKEKKSAFAPFVGKIEKAEEIILEVVPKQEKEKEFKEVICPGCKRKISTAWKFCTYCGAKLE